MNLREAQLKIKEVESSLKNEIAVHQSVSLRYEVTVWNVIYCQTTLLDKNVKNHGRCHVYFQDKAIESTGNPQNSLHLPPPKVVLKSSWIISDPDLITSTKVERGEGPCYYLGQKMLRILQKMHFFKVHFCRVRK